MSALLGPRLRHRLRGAAWLAPMLGIPAGFLLREALLAVDEAIYAAQPGADALSTASATALLAAVGGGMITFSGLVLSFVLLAIQFGSSAYSPRAVTYFLQGRAVRWILALFLATTTYCFVGLVAIGSLGRTEYSADATVLVALVLLGASLAGFIVLVHRVSNRLRLDTVLADLGSIAYRELLRGAPAFGTVQAPRAVEPDGPRAPVARRGRPGQVIAVDRRALLRLARRRGCRIEVLVRIGDGVSAGTVLASVAGADERIGPQVRRCVVVDPERPLTDDALYPIRLIVDIALRALSPGINDPTTAVRALDELEAVLLLAAGRHLGPIELPAGEGTVVLDCATWEEVVDLALLEISFAGAHTIQVQRRLRALCADVGAAVQEPRRPALERYLVELDLHAATMTGLAGAATRTPDRQGLGGSH